MRLLVINGFEYLARIGRFHAKIERLAVGNKDKHYTHVVPCQEIVGGDFERGQWKRTREGMVTPGKLTAWIRQNAWRFTPLKNEIALELRTPNIDEIIEFGGYHNFHSECGIKIWTHGAGVGHPLRYIVMMTELLDNPGTSVTNAAEIIAQVVMDRFLFHCDPNAVTWIEHYPPRGDSYTLRIQESFDRVNLTHNGSRFRLDESNGPGWTHLNADDLKKVGIAI